MESNIKHAIDNKMRAWAKWSASHGVNLDYPRLTPFRRLAGGTVGIPDIDDSEGLEIDKAISELKSISESSRKVAILYWLYNVPLNKMKTIDEKLGRDRARMEKAYIDGWLSQRLYNLI